MLNPLLLSNMWAESPGMIIGLAALMIWSMVWKGIGLWHSARRREKSWFIAILVLNTAGILELIYLFAFAKVHQPSDRTVAHQ